jgi:hypothetical protein
MKKVIVKFVLLGLFVINAMGIDSLHVETGWNLVSNL